jgi:uncharacterized membrane protein
MNMLLRTVLLQRSYLKDSIERTLALSCLFSLAILVVRIGYTGRWAFSFLSWNLFLAIVPYVLTKWLVQHPLWIARRWTFTAVFVVWLLFVPNAFYIITDLFHLHLSADVPLWFELALLLSFAWNGLLFGILSVRQMERIVTVKWSLRYDWLFIYPVMALNAFGVYVGRYLRFNSWDVVTNPFGLAEDVLYLLMHPVLYRFDWSMIFCYAVLMALIYSALKSISKMVW